MNICHRTALTLVIGLFALCLPRLAHGGELTLEWDPPIDGVTTGYDIYYGSASAFYSQSVDVGFTTRYTVAGLADGITHFLAVRAHDAAGNVSDFSNEVYATTAPAALPVITSLALVSSVSPPQPAGTTITWVATASGGVEPYQFQWSVYQSGLWTVLPWTSSSTWNWTPVVTGDYQIRVAVRSAGSTSADGEFSQSVPFAINVVGPPLPPPSSPAITTLTLASDADSPQDIGTTVTWFATATGGVTPYEYRWSVLLAGTWMDLPWTTLSTFTWTPTALGDYEIRVAVRSAGSTNTDGELNESAPFTVTGSNCFFKSDGNCVHLP